MARVTVEDCLVKVSNRFSLVSLVTKRVKQLLKGDACTVEGKNSHVVNALREVAADKIQFDFGTSHPEEQLQKDLRVDSDLPKYLVQNDD